MDMRTRIPVNATLDSEIVEQIDAWLARQPMRVSRSAFLEAAAKEKLAADAAAQSPRSTSPTKDRSGKR